jgi:SAM-dependent methyltransferase
MRTAPETESAPVAAPRVSPRWEDPRTVAGFTTGTPNANLIAFARRVLERTPRAACLDIGCGAARNALPIAQMGFRVAATDLSQPMLGAARARIAAAGGAAVDLVHAPMAPLPFGDAEFDLVVAHGIWNLARSGAEFRAAVAEAARVAKPGAGLFLFTFSRSTLAPDARPDAGETFVHSSWNGEPQCFLTETEVADEMRRAGFVRDAAGPMTEYNVRPLAARGPGGPPAIWEATFVRANAIHDFLAADHRRLEALFDRACADLERVERVAYDTFREGLLRHIAMEEKVLLAEAKRLRGGDPLGRAAQLRLDHAAIAAILAARPVPDLVRELRALLDAHDAIEEGADGVYAECERLCGDGVAALLERIRAVPPVRVAPYADPERIRGEITRALRSAYAARGARA